MPDGLVINFPPTPELVGGVGYQDLPDGSIAVDLDPDEQSLSPFPVEHDANLADAMDAKTRAKLADQVIEWVDADKESRKPWLRVFEDGLRLTGIIPESEDVQAPFKGASKVVHPLLIEHCVQFQARALKQLYPPAGPVKCGVIGKKTEALQAQAKRVEDFMNYQITTLDRSYFWDFDQKLFWLPLVGSCFKKSYKDPENPAFIRSILVKADNILIPYSATSIQDASRITHRIECSHQQMLRWQRSGFYSDVPLDEPLDSEPTEVQSSLDEADHKERVMAEGDAPHVLYECHCEYGVEGEEFRPHVVTVEEQSRQVIGVRRNWRATDAQQRKRLWFTQYRYLPGLGVYGFGIVHLMGGLGEAVTGCVRAFLDSAAFATMQGGFKSKDARIAKNVQLEPGVYIDTEMTFEELQKAFFNPPFKEPSPAMAQILELLIEAGRRFGSTTEALVGDAKNTGPVGTTVALIEQSSEVFSGIHKRLHVALGEEFRLRAELNGECLPDEYPYAVEDNERSVLREDFSERVDVSPVSDPNIYSSTQRIAIAQGELQLAQSAPEMYDTYEAHKRMLSALRSADIDTLLPNPNDIPPTDPVSEGSYLIVGKPVRAHLEEHHGAHLAVHQAQLAMMQGNPLLAGPAQALQAHMAEHLALAYRLEMMQAMGVVLPALDLRGKHSQREGLPAELDNEIAVRAAMAVQQQAAVVQAQAAAAQDQPPPATEPSPIAQQSAEREAMRDQELQGRIAREQMLAASKFLNDNHAVDVPPEVLVETSRRLGRSFDETLILIRMQQAGGQGEGVAPEAGRVNRQQVGV